MRGIPNAGVKCSRCGSDRGDRSGICGRCRLLHHVEEIRKYVITPQIEDELRAVYRERNRSRLSLALSGLEARLGWPRHAIKYHAGVLGLQRKGGRPWSAEEIRILESSAGDVPLRRIARRLHRGYGSVKAKALSIGLRTKMQAGYTIDDLVHCFGVSKETIRSWLDRGWLGNEIRGVQGRRVADGAVLRFLREHPYEYDLRLLDQLWFKSMVFGDAVEEIAA